MAIGLAAATRSEREEVLVIKYSPFEAAAAVVFSTLRIHIDDAEAADLVRHRCAGGGVAADGVARPLGQSVGQ